MALAVRRLPSGLGPVAVGAAVP
ncbi:hypothetical protein ACFTZK_00930 [Streptomyces decoyicus]